MVVMFRPVICHELRTRVCLFAALQEGNFV